MARKVTMTSLIARIYPYRLLFNLYGQNSE